MAMPVNVLVVGDEQEPVRAALAGVGYCTIEAHTGAEAMAIACTRNPDLVLLDIRLPDTDGSELIRQFRELWSRKPIVVVSAHDGEHEKVRALELGADDYICTPFKTGELLARIRVALRRATIAGPVAPSILEVGEIKMDLDRHLVFVAGREVHLTRYEYDLLSYLMKHADKVVTHPQLLDEVWGPEHREQRVYLRVYIGQLRRKLEADPSRPRYLLTEPGVGYRFKAPRKDGN